MKAVSTKQSVSYVPECDKDLPQGEQTTFLLKQLSPNEEALLDNMFSSVRGDSMDMRIGDQQLFALHMGLVGVENFFDEDGNAIKLEREKGKLHGFVQPLTNKFLAYIPKDVRSELANEIIGLGRIDEAEAKN